MQDDTRTTLEARLSELSLEHEQLQAEREQYRKLYLEMLERCALLERGIVAGKKAERYTGEGSQLTLQVLGQVLVTDAPTAAPEDATDEPAPTRELAKRGPARRRPLPPKLPRIDVEVIPHEVQRAGLDACTPPCARRADVGRRDPVVESARTGSPSSDVSVSRPSLNTAKHGRMTGASTVRPMPRYQYVRQHGQRSSWTRGPLS